MLLIDSSALVRFLTEESGWEEVAKYADQSVTIPLALVEIGSALMKKLANIEINPVLAKELLEIYSNNAILLDQNKYVSSAFKIALENNIKIYDSLFIATALGEGYELVSCDDRQIKVAEKLGVKTIRC